MWPCAAVCVLSLACLWLLTGCRPPAPKHGTEFLLTIESPESGGLSGTNLESALQQTGKALVHRMDRLRLAARCAVVPTNVLRLRVGDAARGALTNLGKLVTRSGRLEFRLVHPESEKLVQTGSVPPGHEVMKHDITPPGGFFQTQAFVVEQKPAGLVGHVKRAYAAPDVVSGQSSINFEFDAEGARAFAELTTRNIGRQLAIVLDGVLYSAPVIRDSVTGGSAVIQGSLTLPEARELAALLESAVDLRLRVVEERRF